MCEYVWRMFEKGPRVPYRGGEDLKTAPALLAPLEKKREFQLVCALKGN